MFIAMLQATYVIPDNFNGVRGIEEIRLERLGLQKAIRKKRKD